MKYLGLIWSGVWRKPSRAIFSLVSIVIAFVLFGALHGIDASFSQLVNSGRLNVLYTTNAAGLSLPLSYGAQIEAVHGVTGVTYRSLFLGFHQSVRNIVLCLPVARNFLDANPNFTVPAGQRDAFERTRTGALISASLARRLGWKVGDHVPVHAIDAMKKDGTLDWAFDIVGIFDIPGNPAREQSLLLMNYAYFDEARVLDRGTTQNYMVTIADPSQAEIVSGRIDSLFANSSSRTRTETEKANQRSQLAQIGDLGFFVNAIVGAAFATLLLLTGSTLMQSYRDRIREFAVMKTLGFTDAAIAGLVLSEAFALTLSAALIGLVLAFGLLRLMSAASGGTVPAVHLPAIVIWGGIGAALLLALASASPAAWRAKRLSIIDALAVH